MRPVAFPTVRSGVAPAYEAIVLKGRDAFAYKLIIDARTGRSLARASIVHNLNSGRRS